MSRNPGIVAVLVALVFLQSGGTRGEDRWVDLPPLPVPRQEVGVTALGGKVYVIGGILDNTFPTGLVERFDTESGQWETLPPLPDDAQLHHVGAAALAGKVYAIGGLNNSFRGVTTVYAFDAASGEWAEVAGLSRARGAIGVAASEDRIYAAGGQNASTSYADVEMYIPEEDRWEVLPPMPTARNHLAAAFLEGNFYAVGGRGPVLRAQLERFDSRTGEWTTLEPMPTARAGIAAAIFAGKLFVFGGEGNSPGRETSCPGIAVALGVFCQVEAYDPATNEWEERLQMVTPRHGIGAAAVGNLIYIPGGGVQQGFSTTDVNEAFFPAEAVVRVPLLSPLSTAVLLVGILFAGAAILALRARITA